MPNILIVDDVPESTRLLQLCLERNGCTPTVVTSGSDSIDELTSQNYDLVFLDWTMPEATGNQTLNRLEKLLDRLDPISDFPLSAMRIPVVVFSGTQRDKLKLPSGSHFNIIDFWSKITPFSELFSKTSQIVLQLKSVQKE